MGFADHRRLVFRLLPSGLTWAARPSGRQHGVDACDHETWVRQGDWDCPVAPVAFRRVWPEPWDNARRPGMRLPARRSTGVLFSCRATLRPAQLFLN